jgi:hypothetical protein
VRRSRERADFRWWLLTWRYRHRPALLRAVATHARGTEVHVASVGAVRELDPTDVSGL